MKTIILDEPEHFRRISTDPPASAPPGHALLRVDRVGICGTDLHAFRGRQPFFSYPRILGHELGVEIVELGDGETDLQVGDRCCVEPYLNCGTCIACRRDKPNCCTSLKVLGVHVDGGMREAIAMPFEKLHVSKTLSTDQLALVETLGIGAHAVDRAQIEPGENVLVIGVGPIGLSVVQFAEVAGADLTVFDLNPSRLDFCREQFGVTKTVDGSEITETEDVVAHLADLGGGDLPTLVFDVTGHPGSMARSFELVANGGKLVFVGLFIGDVTFHDPEFHRKEMTLLSSRNSRPQDFRRILELMESGEIDTAPWITHRASFDNLIEEFPGWLEPDAGVVKAVLEL